MAEPAIETPAKVPESSTIVAPASGVVVIETEYFFPTYGKTVKAASQEEALKKVQALIASEKNSI